MGGPDSANTYTLRWLLADIAGWSKETQMTLLTVLLTVLDDVIVRLKDAVTVDAGEALGMPHFIHCRDKGAHNVLATAHTGTLHRRWGVLVVQMMRVILAIVLLLQVGTTLCVWRGRTGLHEFRRNCRLLVNRRGGSWVNRR